MSQKRRKCTAEFKTWVARKALSGERLLSELAAKYGRGGGVVYFDDDKLIYTKDNLFSDPMSNENNTYK